MFDIEAAKSEPDAALPIGCAVCNGRPWVSEFGVATDDAGHMEIVSKPARRCDCQRGRFLAAKDAERREVTR